MVIFHLNLVVTVTLKIYIRLEYFEESPPALQYNLYTFQSNNRIAVLIFFAKALLPVRESESDRETERD
jgi:hypothetical protein